MSLYRTSGVLQDLTLLLTMDEVAEQLRCSLRSVQYLASERTPAASRLPTVHLGRAVRVRAADLERFVDALASQSA